MSHLLRTGRAMVLAMLPLAAVSAQDQDALVDEEPEIRRYTVEMIIFRYAQDVGVGTELFIGQELTPDESLLFDGEIPMPGETPDQPAAETDAEPGDEVEEPSDEDLVVERDIKFVLLDEADYTMEDIIDRLERLDVYEPIMHFGWTQATWSEEETQPIQLASLAVPPDDLDGNVRLYLSRFLHLAVNLELDAPIADAVSESIDEPYPGYGDIGELDRFGSIAPRTGPVRYRIEEDRIFRSGELRYFDHPKFGVLARVTRVEEDEDDGAETELLGYPAE